MIEIIGCTCKNEYQDKVYGRGNRVHNYLVKHTSWRCTVCGQVRQGSTKKKEETKEPSPVKKKSRHSKKGKK